MKQKHQKGAFSLFHALVAAIMVLILYAVFLGRSEEISIQVENTAVLNMQSQMDALLALVLYQYAINQKLGNLPNLENTNPFVHYESYQELPANYGGVITENTQISEGKWFYNSKEKQVVFQARRGRPIRYFSVVFNYADKNTSKAFEAGEDEIKSLKFIEK